MIDQNNEVIKFIQDTEPALASEPSIGSEFLKGLARFIYCMPEDIEIGSCSVDGSNSFQSTCPI